MQVPNFCSHCGTAFEKEGVMESTEAAVWVDNGDHSKCSSCGNITYHNPLPVVVCLVRVTKGGELSGLLLVKRKGGKVAFPGGFMSSADHSIGFACSRELHEETGHVLDEFSWTVSGVANSPKSNPVLIFMEHPVLIDIETLSLEVPENAETEGLDYALSPDRELAFPLHSKALQDWFKKRENVKSE